MIKRSRVDHINEGRANLYIESKALINFDGSSEMYIEFIYRIEGSW